MLGKADLGLSVPDGGADGLDGYPQVAHMDG